MASTLPEASGSTVANESQPASPDVLEEDLEAEVLQMLEAESAEPESLEASATKEVCGEGLDREVADALEAELFGDAPDMPAEAATAPESPDLSETELFGPEDESTKKGGEKAAAATSGDDEEPVSTDMPDAAAAADMEARREMEEGPYDSKTSRFMRGENGELLPKWKVEYAPRRGGAQCRDLDCLERHDQGGVRTIEKSCLRIGRRVLMEDSAGGHMVMMWYHARCIFNTFLRARKSTRTIESELDLEGFDLLKNEDQEILRRIIDGNDNLRNVRFRMFDDGARTPQKRTVDSSDPDGANFTGGKRRKTLQRTLNKGDRVWTHFRCLPREGGGAGGSGASVGGAGASVKSAKPELAMVSEEVTNGAVVVQFESQAHEKERIDLYQSGKGKRIRGWLRYPRLFEGKRQRVPLTWIQLNRNPPNLCGCKLQVWGHACDCGIACNRGHSVKVFGVGDTAA